MTASSSSSIKRIYENLPKSGIVNIYGPSGCGKTEFLSKVKHIQFEHDVLRTKESTIHFLDMMRYSFMPLVLDDFELVESYPGVRELKKPLRVPFFIVSMNRLSGYDFITDWFEFPYSPENVLETFAKKHGITREEARVALSRTNGNMTSASIDITYKFTDTRDIFIDSKEYVLRLINSDTCSRFIDRHLSEHGNTLGIIHENYIEYSNAYVQITHSLSDADIIDTRMYSDISWNLIPFFNVSACLIPGSLCHHDSSSGACTLRPGSIWTKVSNMMMKQGRLKKLRIDRDTIELLALKANNGHTDIADSSYCLDSINQISFLKIKPRVLASLKKQFRSSSL